MSYKKAILKLECLIPRIIWSVIFYLLSVLIYLKNNFNKSYRRLKNNRSSGVAYLLATGPSIKEINISELIGCNTFTVSNFVLHESIEDINPIAHFIAAFHEPLDMLSIGRWLDLIDERLPASTTIVSDFRNKKFIDQKYFKLREIIYVETFPMYDLLWIRPPYIVPRPWTVPQLAIPLIFEMGFDEIVLCGCDHTPLKNYGEPVTHFYNTNLDPRVGASDKLSWQDGGIIKQLKSNMEMFMLYEAMLTLYRKKGKRISRYSRSGWLDFIPPL